MNAATAQVYLCPGGGGVRSAVLVALRTAGFEPIAVPMAESAGVSGGPAVLVAAAHTLEEALAACSSPDPSGRGTSDSPRQLDFPPAADRRLLLVASVFSAPAVRRAVRAGAIAMLHSTDVTPDRLRIAVNGALHGEGRIPYGVLMGLLVGAPGPTLAGQPPAAPAPLGAAALTRRQTTVLSLVAEGHDNAAIAGLLRCSQHTVKNVLYDLMARLQARNRAHAVAQAMRIGLL